MFALSAATRVAEIPKYRQLRSARIETVVTILGIRVGGEERVAFSALKGLISRWSGSVFDEILTLTMRALVHGAIFGKIPGIHNHVSKTSPDVSVSKMACLRKMGIPEDELRPRKR